jgi:hypothetical protein
MRSLPGDGETIVPFLQLDSGSGLKVLAKNVRSPHFIRPSLAAESGGLMQLSSLPSEARADP